MTKKQIQEVDILVTDKSVERATRLTNAFAEGEKNIKAMLQKLQQLDEALKAYRGGQIFGSPRAARNFQAGAANQAEVGVKRTSAGGEARNLALANQLLRTEREREAIELSRSKSLQNNARHIAAIKNIEEANLKVRAAEIRLGEALASQDAKKIQRARDLLQNLEKRQKAISDAAEMERQREAQALSVMRRMNQEIAAGQKDRERRAVAAERELRAIERQNSIEERIIQRNVSREVERRAVAAERAAKAAEKEAAAIEKQRMQPITDRVNAQRSRDLTEMRLFGDGGASLLKIQTGLMMNYAIINSVTGAFSNAVRESVAFDASLRNLQAIVQVSDTSMEQLKGSLIEVANESKYTANEVAQASLILAQAGFSNTQIEASVGAVMKLATATGTDLSRAVDIATSILGIFNMEAGRMEHVANSLTQALNASKLDIEKLTLGIQYAGNTAFDAGVSFEELTAGLGAMANAGIRSGSTLGTGMRQILVSLEKPSEKFLSNLSKLGLTMNDVNLKSKGLYGVMKTLKDGGFSAADAIESFEVRSAAAFIALSNNLPMMESMETSLYRTAAATTAAETQMRSLDSQFKRFSGALTTVVYQALEPMIYALRDVVKAAGDWLSSLAQSPETLRMVGSAVSALFGAFAGYKVLRLVAGLFKLMPADLTVLTRATVAASMANSTFALSIRSIQTGLLTSAIGIRSWIAGTVGISTAMNAAAIGVRALGTAIGVAFPIIGAITLGLSLFSMATASFGNEVGRSTSQVDRWKARVEAARGVTDSYKAKIGELETKIKSLYGRYNELNKSQAALRTEIDRVRIQFAGMGSAVNGTENSVDDLIAKLGQLWSALQREYILRIGIEIQNLEGLLAIQQVEFNQSLSSFKEKIAGGFSTGDEVADAAIRRYESATTDLEREDARRTFDNRITELSSLNTTGEVDRMAEAEVRKNYGLGPDVNLSEAVLGDGFIGSEAVEIAKQRILDDINSKVAAGSEVQGDLQRLGETELAILNTKDQVTQRNTDQETGNARLAAQPLFEAADRTGLQIDRTLSQNEKTFKDDPRGLYQANKSYADSVRASIFDQVRQIEESDMPEPVKQDLISKLNEQMGKFGVVYNEQFDTARQESSLIGKIAADNTNAEFRNAFSDIRTGNTEAEINKNAETAGSVAQRRKAEATRLLQTQIPDGESLKTPKWAEMAYEIEKEFENDLASIEDARRESVENIRSGLGGANAAASKDFNEFMDNLQTSDMQQKTALDIGGATKNDTVAALDGNVRTAQARLDAVTPLVNQMTPLAKANQLSPEDQATYKRLVSEQDQLRNYIKNTSDDVVRIANDTEATYGFNTARRQDFERAVNSYQDELQGIENSVTLKRMSPEQAVAARAAVGDKISSRLGTLQTELAPLRAKVDSGVGLSAAEDAVFRQGVSEENRLADLLRGTSDLDSGGAGGGGGGGDTPFDLLIKQLQGQFGDAERGLGMKTMDGPTALNEMQMVVDKAREELTVRQQTLATLVPGSERYNELKEEERQLTDLILQSEQQIKAVKEEQGMSQINLLESVREWAKQNLDLGAALENGFLNVLGTMKSGLSTLFSDLMSGTKSAKDAFRDFAMSVVESIQNVIAEMMAMYVMKKILGLFGMTITGGSGPQIVPISQMTGGVVRKAAGGMVEGNLARDSKLHMLMPGEYVLRKSAVDMIGVDALNEMNALGNRAMAAGGHIGVAKKDKGPLGMTNVYVVSPDQQPVPGPSDIIAVINDDIARGGSTKRLIKTVAMGY